MGLNFDGNCVERVRLELLDCQVELILKSLEYYAYSYKFMYPRFGGSASKEENLRISLVCDTYEQIMNEFGVSGLRNACVSDVFGDCEKFFKKVS